MERNHLFQWSLSTTDEIPARLAARRSIDTESMVDHNQSMNKDIVYFLMYFASIMVVFAVVIIPIVIIPRLTADPLARHRDKKTRSVDYSMTDFMILFAMLGIGITLPGVLKKVAIIGFDSTIYYAYIVVFMILTGGIWWTTVISLSRANLKSQLHRSLILGFAVPLIWCGSFCMLFGAITSVGSGGDLLYIGVGIASLLAVIAAHRYIAWAYRNCGVVASETERANSTES